MPDEELVTPGGLHVDPGALSWRFSRASGAGGQHVNRTESRVELRCDLELAGLPAPVFERISARLATGEVRVTCETHRSQYRNREQAKARLAEILDAAARSERPRRATRPGRGAVERRLEAKRRASGTKSARRWRPDD